MNLNSTNLNSKMHLLKPTSQNLYANIHSNIIYNSPALETMKLFFKEWMIKQTLVHANYGMLLNNQEGICSDLQGLWSTASNKN